MKKVVIAACALTLSATLAWSQTPSSAPTGQKTLAATVGLYVFPNAGQTPETQSKDEGDCYNWAVQNTGTDPFQLGKQAEANQAAAAQAQQQAAGAGAGAGARGAVRGAAAGALVGEIASDDAGEGAAIGAAAGVVAGRRRGKQAQAQAQAQVEQTTQANQQATAQAMDGFKKAFSVCLESKKYMVKF